MNYKIIDGVAYKCEAIDLSEIKVEVNQAKAVVTEQTKKLAELDTICMTNTENLNKQIESYRNQIAAITVTINSLVAKRDAAVKSIEDQKIECTSKIARVKEQLADKQDIISALLPEEAKIFGF